MFKLNLKALIVFAAFGLLGSQSFAAYICTTYDSIEDGRRFTGTGFDANSAAEQALQQCKFAQHADSNKCRHNMSCQPYGGGNPGPWPGPGNGGPQNPYPSPGPGPAPWPGNGGHHHPYPSPYPPAPNPWPAPNPGSGQGQMSTCTTASGASVYTSQSYDQNAAANAVVNTCLANVTSYKPDCRNNLQCHTEFGQPSPMPSPGYIYLWVNGGCGQYTGDGQTFIQYVDPRYCSQR
jgi:hypothetical protein